MLLLRAEAILDAWRSEDPGEFQQLFVFHFTPGKLGIPFPIYSDFIRPIHPWVPYSGVSVSWQQLSPRPGLR